MKISNITTICTPPPPANSTGYEYESEYYLSGVEGYRYDYLESGNNYLEYGYEYSGYIGNAPEYVYSGLITMEMDERGNVAIYPYVMHGIVLDGDYIRVYLTGEYSPSNINIKLPEGWAYEISHNVEVFDNHGVEGLEEYGVAIPFEESVTYTIITFNHNWNHGHDSGNIGFMPFASGAPGGFTIVTLPSPFDLPAWNNVFANNAGNLVISIPQDITLPGTITIPTGRDIIIVSQGTNLNGSVGYPVLHSAPATRFVIRINSNSRHFIVSDGATLRLSHIFLDGRTGAGDIPAVGVWRGGINVYGRLYMHPGSVVGNSRANTANGGVSVLNGAHFIMRGGEISNIFTFTGVVVSGGSTFVMWGGHVRHNGTITNGWLAGGVRLVDANSTFTMHGGTVSYNNGGSNAGGVYVGTGTRFYMMTNAATISGNHALGHGGGVHLTGDSRLTMHGGTISGNTAVQGAGGGIRTTGLGNRIYMHAGTISGNSSNHGGGGISIDSAGVLTMLGPGSKTISNNTASGAGGLILLSGSQAILGGTGPINIEGNIATNPNTGAGIQVNSGSAVLTINGTNVNIRNHTAANGSGIHVVNGTVNMYTGNIYNNTTTNANQAGGVQVNAGTFNMRGGSIHDNTGTTGGGVRVQGSGTFNMQNDGEIETTKIIRNNHSTQRGGGIRVATTARENTTTGFHMQAGRIYIEANTCVPHIGNPGSAITLETGLITMSSPGAYIRHHSSVAINVQDGTFIMSNGNIVNNGDLAHPNSQAIHLSTEGTHSRFYMSGGQISNNISEVTAIHIGSSDSHFIMTGGTISGNNIAAANASGLTGAVFVGSVNSALPSTLTMYGGTITGNTSGDGGGGIIVWNSGQFRTAGTGSKYITDNHAAGNGGGIHLYHTSSEVILGGTGPVIIDGNTSGANTGAGIHQSAGTTTITGANVSIRNHTATNGSGVHVDSGTFNMYTGNIYNNTTTNANQAGGVQVNAGTFNMRGGSIRNNRGPTGGGVRVQDTGVFNMHGGEIYANEAATAAGLANGLGGGVYVTGDDAEFTMTSGIIGDTNPLLANRALRGGGVLVSNGGRFYMKDNIASDGTITTGDGMIVGNEATIISPVMGGGGVAVAGNTSHFTMSAGVIKYNIGFDGAGVNVNGATFVMEAGGTAENPTHGTIRNNISSNVGGGIYVVVNGTFEMSAGVIEYNNALAAGGIANIVNGNTTISGTAVIRNNTATNHAGGIGSGGILIINGGTITGNTAGTFGGGIQVNSAGGIGTFTMNGGHIYNNTAGTNGGGVFIQGLIATFTMTGGTIGHANPDYGNAAINGGGVWVGLNATFNLQGTAAKTITNNEADYGGGIWVGDTGTMTVYNTAANVQITHNTATYLGGGIYTQRHEYEIQLTRIPGAIGVLPENIAYSNLILHDVYFANNTANRRYVPPVNATAVLPATLPNRAFINTSQPTNPIRVHPLNNYDINFRADDVLFEFFKTNEYGITPNPGANLLPGARFRVYRADSTSLGGIDQGGLVPQGAAADPASPWEAVDMILYESESGPGADPIAFEMTPGFIYQLVEYLAPSGFQIPMGQWRIWVDTDNVPDIMFQRIGGTSFPEFIYSSTGYEGVNWFLPNMRQFELPLTGGIGTSMFILAGSTVLIIAVLALSVITIKKKLAVKPHRYRRTDLL